jgi:hypothetical protein
MGSFYTGHDLNGPMLGYECFLQSLGLLATPGINLLYGLPSLSNFFYIFSLYHFIQKDSIRTYQYALMAVWFNTPFFIYIIFDDGGKHVGMGLLLWYFSILLHYLITTFTTSYSWSEEENLPVKTSRKILIIFLLSIFAPLVIYLLIVLYQSILG